MSLFCPLTMKQNAADLDSSISKQTGGKKINLVGQGLKSANLKKNMLAFAIPR